MPPRLTIVIPIYDAGAFLEETVATVQAQSFEDWELLLFDDGSRDDSRKRARAIAEAEPRARCLTHPGGANHGQFATRVAWLFSPVFKQDDGPLLTITRGFCK